VSCPELDVAVEAALRQQVRLGLEWFGGRFGGSAIALIKTENIEVTKNAIKKAFAEKGFKEPRFFQSLPSEGAEIL
jgi:galactokinase